MFGHHSKTYYKYLASYGALLLTAIIALVFVSQVFFIRQLRTNLEDNHRALVQQSVQEMDSDLQQIYDIEYQISTANQNFFSYYLEAPSPVRDLRLVNEFKNLLAPSTLISEIALADADAKMVYTSTAVYSAALFFDRIFSFPEGEPVASSLADSSRRIIRTAQRSGSAERYLAFINTPSVFSRLQNSVLIFFVQERHFLSFLSPESAPSQQGAILDSSGQVVVSTMALDAPLTDGISTIRLHGTNYLIYREPSSVLNWTYYFFLPASETLAPLYRAQAMLALFLLVVLAAGTLVIHYAMKVNYRPIQELTESLGRSDADDLESLKDAIASLAEQNNHMRSQLMTSPDGQALKDSLLFSLHDMTQAVEDGATRPVYYESRVIHLKLDEDTLHLIDNEYDIMADNADPYVIEKSKKELGQMEAILGADQTIDSLVNDILDHYENYRENILTGKAMIVAYSRPIAMKIYKRILALRPAWTEKIAVVMTQGNNDPEEWREIIGNKAHKDDMARKFKDNNSPLKIAIVVDMWLTGFDVPSLATMYVYKPMAGHNLMQAIARVNRVFKDKEGGLVVDYVGIAAALKQAMNDYTARDKKNYGDTDVSKAAYPKFLEKLSICRDLFHGFSYEKFMTGNDLDRAKLISGGVNFILGKSVAEYELPDNEKTQNVFIKEALLLKQALSLCSSLVDDPTRMEAAFFESVRTMTVRLVSGGSGKKFTLPEVNERINELLKHSIKSEGVINLFSDVQTSFSLFDPKFLEEVANMKEKNLAVELLKKLIAEQVSVYRRTNIVKSKRFSEIIQSAMNRYLNGMLTNEEVIQELLKLAKDIAAAAAEGEKLGLTADELAFYDALTKPQAIKDFYQHDELIAITKELTDMLRKNRTIDWQKKESARAGMRRLVKRLLKKYKYPPEGMDDAVQTVMSQCEMWADNVMTV